ncbi:hypothetical protein AB0F77_31955 [Streptomyces sp. NPDC026672]|uniref:hypothetical protein n=1 Tax=unclassified Streptomyces TaxID=2593676 RepID=UPI0033DB856A
MLDVEHIVAPLAVTPGRLIELAEEPGDVGGGYLAGRVHLRVSRGPGQTGVRRQRIRAKATETIAHGYAEGCSHLLTAVRRVKKDLDRSTSGIGLPLSGCLSRFSLFPATRNPV